MDVSQASNFADLYPPVCPYEIKITPMRMNWDQLTMLHWRYRPDEVQKLLPKGLTVETFDGSAWVGLVPFQMTVDIPGMPAMRRWLYFPETNVRTYVRGESGQPGVWFFSLEASSLPAVLTARATYQVPYCWADMSIAHDVEKNTIRYESRRKWPSPRGAESKVEISIGEPFRPGQASDLDNFLTSRWELYGAVGPLITYAKMFHEPWPLYHGSVIECDDELVRAAGFSQPTGDPIVHYSPGVSVRCGWPSRGSSLKR